MDLSFLRPSSTIRSLEDGIIDTGRGIKIIGRAIRDWMAEKRHEQQQRRFERMAEHAGYNVSVLRTRPRQRKA